MMSAFLVALVVIMAVIAICVLAYIAFDRLFDGYSRRDAIVGTSSAAAAVLMLAALIAVPVWASGDDGSRGLCLAGHQEYSTSHSGVMAGKVFVPTTHTEKVWVCDRWEK